MRVILPFTKDLKNMLEEEAVKTGQEAVTDEGVKNDTVAPEGDIDYEAEYLKMKAERDNYKNGLLVAKGKKTLQDFAEDEQEEIQEVIAKTVKAEVAALKANDLDKREEDFVQKLIRENKELKIAQRNRQQMTAASTGSKSSDTEPEVKTSVWSAEQLAYFKKRGIDPNKVEQNLRR